MISKKAWMAPLALGILMFTAFVPGIASASSTPSSAYSSSTPVPQVIFVRSSPNAVTCSGSGFCPSMITKAYNFTDLQSSGVNGTGQTVVIDDACGSPTISSDLKTFDSEFGLANPTLNILTPQGTPCSDSGWALETSLDVEWSHVMAPGATIDLVEGASATFTDLYGIWTYSLKNNLGNQISNSWLGSGDCGANSILKKAAKAGVTIAVAAGDGGAWGENFGGNAQPADCQGVLTVGGTSLYIKSNGQYSSESAWSGSGGGYVEGVSEPTYQSSVKITDTFKLLAKSDVSAVADPNTGVWVYDSGYGGWIVVGGTSVATPLWSGTMADVNQVRATNGFKGAGLIDPFLYTNIYGVKGKGANYNTDFHDVTTGNDGWPAGKGWDVPTGLGTFNGGNLVPALGDASGA